MEARALGAGFFVLYGGRTTGMEVLIMWCEVFAAVTILKMYKKDPGRKKRDYPVSAWRKCDAPVSWHEVQRIRGSLKERDVTAYYRTFPEERH
jgi:hypothetical protein